MPGERNLATLLQNIKPEVHDGVFVFCSIPANEKIPAALAPMLIFRELEGTTIVVRREEAERASFPHQFASRLITLTVHSSLAAVGFLAVDHLFVPEHRADEALRLLQEMSRPGPECGV